MDLRLIENKDTAEWIFTQGMFTEDENRNNYSPDQFNKAWDNWLSFYVLYDDEEVVAFCGIRVFDEDYARIFDRYFVMPEYRNQGLQHKEWSTLLVKRLVEDTITQGYKPFFSIQTEKKRRAIQTAVKTFNKYIKEEFKVLDGLYCTVSSSKDNPNSWQNIATISPYKINLEKRNEQDSNNDI